MPDDNKNWKSSGPPAGFKASGPPPEFSVPGAPEGLPSAGAAETISNIIPESEAAQRISTTAPNVTADPRTSAAQTQEARLNEYDPGSQLMGANAVASVPGLVRGLIRSPLATAKGLARVAGGAATGRIVGGALGMPRLGMAAGGLLAGSTLKSPEYAPEFVERDATALNKVPFAGEEPVAVPEEVSPIDESRLARRNIPATKFPVRLGPEPPPGLGAQAGTPTEVSAAAPVRGAEPLVLTPEEAQRQEQLQSVAEDLARRRGMQYAGGVRTAGPNKPANRLFPSGRVFGTE